MNTNRKKPEDFLKQIHQEEEQKKLGKLKIFLGAAPGVGKTYAMLQDALNKLQSGTDVVIGIVETHGRKKTLELTKEFEILSRMKIEYHGQVLEEFNLDLAIHRAPALILIDELAHTNIPGTRHTKRWQDINEILNLGIDVYTTLNVQHIESLNDTVAQITGIHIKETVPDQILKQAHSIELIDLPSEELLKRLHAGEVYIKEQASIAAKNFFREGNLTALRELALRVAAETVDEAMLAYRKKESIQQTWPSTERVLCYINSEPEANKLIIATQAIANKLHADWIVITNQNETLTFSESKNNKNLQNLRYAETLGAETHVLSENSIAAIMHFAQEHNVTKIVLLKPKFSVKNLFFPSFIQRLIYESQDLDVYLINQSKNSALPEIKQTIDKTIITRPTEKRMAYDLALSFAIIATFINYTLYTHTHNLSNTALVYLFATVIIARQGFFGPSILSSVLNAACYDFFFLPPKFRFSIFDPQAIISLVVMLSIAYIISHLTVITKKQLETTRLREKQTKVLHALGSKLIAQDNIEQILKVAAQYIGELFDGQTIAWYFDGNLKVYATYGTTTDVTIKEQGIAQWVYNLGQKAGIGSDTLTAETALYLPLSSQKGTMGVISIKPKEPDRLLVTEQLNLLEVCLQQISLSLEINSH